MTPEYDTQIEKCEGRWSRGPSPVFPRQPGAFPKVKLLLCPSKPHFLPGFLFVDKSVICLLQGTLEESL